MKTKTNIKENKMRNKLEYLDYLEIIDMDESKLAKYSKKELIRFIWFQAECLHDAEKKLAGI